MSIRNFFIVLALQLITGFTLSNILSASVDGSNNLADIKYNWIKGGKFLALSKPINPSQCPTENSVNLTRTSLQKRQNDPDLPFQCMRKYLEEQTKKFDLYFVEDTIDEKAANLIYITNIINPYNDETFTFSDGNAHFRQQTAGSRYNEQLCSEHLNSMLSVLEELNYITEARRQGRLNETLLTLEESHFRLARVLDSYGQYESSLMSGKHHFFGSYSQCQGSEMILDKNAPDKMVSARYCTAQLKFDQHLNKQLITRRRSPLQAKLNLRVGICIPETCHTVSFDNHKPIIQRLVDTSFRLPPQYYVEQHPQVESIFCGVDKDSNSARIPPSGKLLLCFLTCWLALVFYSTYKQSFASKSMIEKPREEANRLMDCVCNSMSFQSSYNAFISTHDQSDTKKRVELNFLNPVKVFIQLLVVCLHTSLFQYSTLADLPRFFATSISYNFFSLALRLDTLFTVSGILIINSEFRSNKNFLIAKMNSWQKVNWFFRLWCKRFVKRYLRLIPLYFLVVWFKKSLFSQLGSGPFWDYGFNNETLIGACHQESWFVPFTYENSLNYLGAQCAPQSWYIANEVFFISYLTPIIVLTVVKPRLALLSGILVLIMSGIGMIYGLITMPPRLVDGFRELKAYTFQGMYREYSYLYAAPYYHSFAYLIGIYSGYLLHQYSEDPTKRWPKWMTGKFTYLCLLLLIILTFEQGILSSLGIAPPYMFEFTLTGGRILASLATAILFLRATTDCKDNFLIRLFSTKFWRIAAKLTYPIYITHWEIIEYERLSLLSLQYYSNSTMFFLAGAHIFFSIWIGLIFHILFEIPFDKLIQNFIFSSAHTKEEANEFIEPALSQIKLKKTLTSDSLTPID